MTEWKKIHGTQEEKPAEVDITSSPTTVYQRRDIKKDQDDNGNSCWSYEERELTKDEYILYQSTLTPSKGDNMILQAALIDIYELILEMGGAL